MLRLTASNYVLKRSFWALKPAPSAAQQFAQRVTVAVERGDANLAAARIREALAEGTPVPPGVLSAALHALEADKRPADALTLWHDVSRTATSDPLETWPVGTVTQIMKLHCAVGDVAQAKALVSLLERRELLKGRAVSGFLDMCAASDSVPDADWIEAAAERCKVRLNDEDFANLMWVHRGDASRLESIFQRLGALPGCMSIEAATKIAAAFGESDAHALEFAPAEVEVATGRCGRCGGTLQPHHVTAATRDALLHDIRTKLAPQPTKDPRGAAAFETFRRFIEPATQYDVIVDGANVGYYGLSNWAHTQERKPGQGLAIDYDMVEKVMAMVRRHGLRPIVLLHHRHLEPQNLRTSDAKRLAEKWTRAREVYTTPPKVNDDILWLYASVFHSATAGAAPMLFTPQTMAAATSTDATPIPPPPPPPPSTSGGGRGKSIMVVTNDKMRDHHFALLSPGDFKLWRQHHQIEFRCERDHEAKMTHVVLRPPSPFGVMAQRAVGGGAGVHLPISQAASDGDDDGPPTWWCGLPSAA